MEHPKTYTLIVSLIFFAMFLVVPLFEYNGRILACLVIAMLIAMVVALWLDGGGRLPTKSELEGRVTTASKEDIERWNKSLSQR